MFTMTQVLTSESHEDASMAFAIGRRIRERRVTQGLTVTDLAQRLERAPSQISLIENGRKELKLSELRQIAAALTTTVEALMSTEPPNPRAALEIALDRAQRGSVFSSLNIPSLAIRKSLSDDAIATILALHAEIQRLHHERAATPEIARQANTALRLDQRRRNNYFAHLEVMAQDLLRLVDHHGGPLSQRSASELAQHLGFTLHYVGDFPTSTRSITDHRHGRIYLPATARGIDPRSALLQALATHVLEMKEPRDYEELLRQRVETNYLAGALLMPEASAVAYLSTAKAARELSVEDLRDAFAVPYETAAHRFTNLATHHLDIPVHFLKVHDSGIISKAYENDNVVFPTDVLGSVEGQIVCRWWAARQVFTMEDRLTPYHQYSDKPAGTYWCTSSIQVAPTGVFSVSVGTTFEDARWFRGRDTKRRFKSTCPDETCCRRPSPQLASRWDGMAWPSAQLNSSLLAAIPTGTFTGVDRVGIYEFLERQTPGVDA
ncbi:MAG: helix-turn-helix domain-containing protein [Acidimicrobiaceae bacterium]|nr:helix-turn-helix domain-containing protein [Acidimicrobiaceae bacterium]